MNSPVLTRAESSTRHTNAPEATGAVARSPSLLERVRGATLACNIDGTGRRIRLAGGITALAAGSLLLLGWVLPGEGRLLSALAALLIAAGVFMIFEARASFCVLRALGFRTRW